MNHFFNSHSKVGKFKWELDAKGGGNQAQVPDRVNSDAPVDPNGPTDFDSFMPDIPNPDLPSVPEVSSQGSEMLIAVPS